MNYYNFLISTTENKLKIAKIRSEDGTATGTGLLNQSGESIHPSISSFISQAGITIDPPVGKIPFSYLNNYISTSGCTGVQSTFVASQHNLSFLPAKIKALYEPQVTSTKIQFETPNSKTVILEDRPGRIIDYTFPDQGSVGENYDYDDVVEITGYGELLKCKYSVYINFIETCDSYFSIRIYKEVQSTCVNKPLYVESECQKIPQDNSLGEFKYDKIINYKGDPLQRHIQENKIEKFTEKSDFDIQQGYCKPYFYRVNFSMSIDGNREPNFEGGVTVSDPEIKAPSVSSGDSIVDAPGIGISLTEGAISLGVGIVNPFALKAGPISVRSAVNDLGVMTESITDSGTGSILKSAASIVSDPVGVAIEYAFDFLNESVFSTNLKDIANSIKEILNEFTKKCKENNKFKEDCAKCVGNSFFTEFRNKNSKLYKLIDRLIANSGISKCC
jgi:hypothetical protein